MKDRRIAFLLIAAVVASVFITIGCLLYHQTIERTDFRADRFGFPYYWLEHVTVTFAGRADYWNISTSNLVINFVLFFIVSFAALCLTLISQVEEKLP